MNYLRLIDLAIERGVVTDPNLVGVAHDEWCALRRYGGHCTCEPDVYLMEDNERHYIARNGELL